MTKPWNLWLVVFLVMFLGAAALVKAQKIQPKMPIVHVRVDMVQLDIAVTDRKGDYVTGLNPYDFAVFEDNIRQNIATFGEENEAPRKLEDFKPGASKPKLVKPFSFKTSGTLSHPESSLVTGSKIFILFDTSNYMYRDFVYAQDAVAEFIRFLDHPDQVAFYSYSRDVSRMCPLNPDRSVVLSRVRQSIVGDDAALYDALILTLKDAGRVSGRKMLVVFSNGPDNSSMASPEDVRELAQSEGIPIYMVSTRKAEDDPISSAIFKRITASTGGKAYFAKYWRDQERAFASIRDDMAHLYTVSYYPQPNPNHGWRSISVKLVGKTLRKYRVRTRSGYRPMVVRATTSMPENKGSDGTPVSSLTSK